MIEPGGVVFFFPRITNFLSSGHDNVRHLKCPEFEEQAAMDLILTGINSQRCRKGSSFLEFCWELQLFKIYRKRKKKKKKKKPLCITLPFRSHEILGILNVAGSIVVFYYLIKLSVMYV